MGDEQKSKPLIISSIKEGFHSLQVCRSAGLLQNPMTRLTACKQLV